MSGMRTKADIVHSFTAQMDYDVYVLVETWLTSNFFDAEFFDANLFNVFRKDRDAVKTGCQRGGGVIVAVKRELRALLISLANDDSLLDQLCVNISGNSSKESLYVVTSYIPPGSSYELYKAHADNISSLVLNNLRDNHLCVLGDFNLSNINWVSSESCPSLIAHNMVANHELYLVDSILSLNLKQINSFANELNRILDLIFVSDNLNYRICDCINPITATDKHHIPLVIKLDFYCFSAIKDNKLSFNYSLCDFFSFNELLSNINWDDLFTNLDTAYCFSIFKSILYELCLDKIPVKKKKPYKLPWYSKDLKKLKNLKNKFYKKFKTSGNHVYFVKYQHYLKKIDSLNKTLYSNYVRDTELNIKSNPKLFWNYVKSKKGCSSLPTGIFLGDKAAETPSDAANLFAEYFGSNFVQNDVTSAEFSNISSSLNFGSLILSSEDISNGIIKLRPSTHVDVDGLSATLIKNCPALVYPLKLIFNKSLSSGTFIDDWKLTTVMPVFKNGNRSDVRNYRPISKLSAISKIFEHTVNAKLNFAVKSIISPYQHGFVAGRSTVSNLAVFSEYCFESFSLGFQVDCIYTDFSKAFDRVSHSILIQKLACIGFHSIFLRWLESYLCNRRCVVSIDGATSCPFVPSSGVPQGSVLGPLLFILFINDISSCFSFAKFLLYADDLKVFSVIKNTSDAIRLQDDIDKLHLWCLKSRLSLNISKCFQLTYSKISNSLLTSYHISANDLNRADEIKDLGVVFDDRFSFNKHISYVTAKAYSVLGFVRRNASKFSDPYTFKLLYSSFVRSHLEYAVFIWRPYNQNAINRVERVQKIFLKFALRCLNFSDPVPSYSSRLMLLNLKSLESRRSVLCLSFTYNIIKGIVDCPFLLERIRFNVPRRSLRNFLPFYGCNVRTQYASNAPIYRAIREFNAMNNVVEVDFSIPKTAFLNLLNSYF
ncbi:PREDICTED: RNA-directed DNA polymerase from mobile element jockey-like isoform X1 [Rhagoletis zephyria]|uniref:RNA-directed DNA polymerase from mobile element jockey-like isoform X1 n=1 Tax=Rhagoletis zephyria TaxID=28612 RepID=UPI00081129D8|nr:PREDICTED: RNA-directed DNA polymerase from mobile element jockey-like isoform X1 [Rhagoletis zephyria]